jgi:hypothetical protein
VRHFKLKIQKTPSRQTSSFLSKEHKQKKSSSTTESKNTVHKHRTPNPKKKKRSTAKVGSDVSQGPKLYQSN